MRRTTLEEMPSGGMRRAILEEMHNGWREFPHLDEKICLGRDEQGWEEVSIIENRQTG